MLLSFQLYFSSISLRRTPCSNFWGVSRLWGFDYLKKGTYDVQYFVDDDNYVIAMVQRDTQDNTLSTDLE